MFSANDFFMLCDGSAIACRAAIPKFYRWRAWRWVLALCLSTTQLLLAADVAPKNRLIVGSELDFPPFALVREGGQADGFTAELWRAVAQEAHLDATIKTGPFHQILEQFKQGEIDVLINLAQSEERARFADFSVPHVRMAGAVFIRKGERGIAVEDDLANKPLIVIKADLAHDYARKRGWTELTLVETAAAGMKLLASSTQHEAMLIGRLVGLQTIRELKLGDIEPLPLKVGFQQDFAFAVRKGNSDLLARINDGLANVRASGAYDAISAKWFGSLDPTPLTMESVLQYLVPAGAAILLLLLAYLRERSLRMRWKSTASKLDATISDLTQAQMSLRESEERFKAFMDRTPGIAFIKDEFGRYVYVNKTWEDIYARDWRGKTDVELWPSDNVAMFNDSDRRALEAGHATEAFETVQDKDGRPQDWWVMKFPIVDAEGKRLLGGMAMDITARNRAERERATLQAAIEQQMEGLALLDNDGRYLYVNPAHAAIYGYKVDELIGRSWKILYEPAQAELLEREHFPSLLETGHWRGELNGRKKNGESFFQEISLTRIHAGYGTDSAVGLICACRDISAEKQKQQKLAEAHVALSHAMPGIGRIDTVGRYLEVNDMYAGMLGFDPEELIGTDWSRTVHFKDRPRALASYERMLEVGKGECEARGVRKDGSTFFKQVLLVKIVDDNGRHVGHHCFMRDITERKRGEEALCQSEQHLIAAQSIVHLGSWEWDFQSGRNSWSDENYRLFGYEPGSVEPIYDSWVNRIHPDDRSRVQEHLSSAFNGTTQCDIEFRVMHPNSEIRFVHWRGELFRDASGNELRMAGTVLDITERKRADEALRQAYDELERRVEERTAELQQAVATLKKTEALLHQAVDVANLGIFERDHDSDEVHYSPTLRKILALPEDRKGSLGEFMAKIHPDDRANVIAARRWSRERAGDGQFSLECRVIRSDGSIGWIMIRSQAFFEGSGDGRRPVRTVGAVLDITERKRAEEALRKLTEDLDRRVVERTRELAESQSRLRSLVAEITKTEERERRRLAVELHDYLAQMLTVSRMNIGRAEKLAAADALKQRLAEAMESVDESIAYTRSLMAQLSPRMLYDLGLPAALTWLAAQQQERHGLKVEIGGAAEGFALDEECSVLAYQCVRELLWNIVKHAQANQALVSYKIEHCELTVEVADDGRGFDPESLHASGNGVEKFGLFSIRERLELSGGKLEVTSQLGRGTRVRFTLPAPPSEMAPAVAHGAVLTSAVLGNEKQLRIALVDDHTVVRRGMRQMLEEYADLTVVGEAKDGLAGVELAREFRPDVVVMDVNIPRMNGIEATKLILQEMPSTIVVGLSFDNGAEVAQKMKAAGAFTCVTKERAAEDIHQAIVDAVEARRGAAAD